MIVDCAAYKDGRREPGELALEGACEAAADGAFVWLGLHDPTVEEFDAVAAEFDLHELAVEDALHPHQRPKLEVFGETLFVVLKTVRYVGRDELIESGQIMLFVNASFVIAVRHGAATPLVAVRRRLESRPDLLTLGAGSVLYAVMDQVVDEYAPVVEDVESEVQDVEQAVFAPERENPAERIVSLDRDVLEFHRDVSPLIEPVHRLARGDFSPMIDEHLKSYFRDVHDHLIRVVSHVQGMRELLGSALQANLTQVTVHQNEDMRKISAWVAILAVPTMVAGIYGMNFDTMPELRWRYGYPAVIGIVLVACGLLYRRFKRSGWL